MAQTSDSTAVVSDSTGGKVRIKIGEGGISIEGDTRRGTGEWVEVNDERIRFSDKGTDIVRFGESVFVGRDEQVLGDLIVFGDNAIVEGRVTGNVVVIGGNVRVRSGAEIRGDAVAIGGEIEEDDDVIIHGERVEIQGLLPFSGWIGGFDQPPLWAWTAGLLVAIFVHLVLFFIVVLFLRERVAVAHDHLSASYLKSFGVGLLSVIIGFFGLAIVTVPLIITLIGIPLAILLVISCCGICIIGVAVFAVAVGRVIAARMGSASSSPFLFVFLGVAVLALPELLATLLRVPGLTILGPLRVFFKLLGFFLASFALVSGIGSLVLSRFGGRRIIPRDSAPGASATPAS